MKAFVFIVALALGCAAPVAGIAAGRLTVHAEDTPGVTRVELNVGDTPFSLEAPEPGVIDFVTPYRFQSVNLTQLISGVAARRVANARIVPDHTATRLRMVLNCECGFDFSVSSGVLSVRIKDPGAEGTAPDNAALIEAQEQSAAAGPKKPAPHIAPAPAARPLRPSASLVAAAPPPEATTAEALVGNDDRITAVQLSPFADAPDEEAVEEVTLARDHLMRQLSRAAEQGLIQFVSEEAASQSPAPEDALPPPPEAKAESPAQKQMAVTDTEQQEPPARNVAAAPAAAPPKPVEMPLRVRTAVDKTFSPDRRETIAEVAYCIDADRLNVAAWAQPGNFLETTQELRAKLLDEFDQPQPDAATGLARHFILNGFGAEARKMLRVYGDVIEDPEVLDDLAKLVDLKAPDPEGPIAQSAPCHAEAALWRAIAGLPNGEPGSIPDEQAADANRQALDAFARLPAVTRRILGARFMNNLIARGDLELAGQLDLIFLRTPLMDDEALTLARARLLSETGELEEAEALYTRLSQSNRPDSQQALILLLDSRISRNAGGSRALSDALGDAAFSARGTAAELPLKVAEIRSRTLTDGASAALEVLQDAMERAGGGSDLLQDVGHAALEQLSPVDGDVVDYAKAVMSLRPHVSEGPSGDPARRQVASALTAAGLPNLALAYLEPARARPDEATAIVAAGALLALDDPDGAIAALHDQTGPNAISVRIDALERLGRFGDAHRLAAALDGDAGDAQAARALRAGDWADASAAGATPHRLLAAYMASQTSLDGAEAEPSADSFLTTPKIDLETTLESVQSVVEASRSARSIIEKALEDG